MIPHYDVAIVGAGASGIAAASDLTAGGLSIVVLEASDRIGGRINTILPFGFAVDVGASWIHSGNENPIYKIAQENGIRTETTNWNQFHVFRNGAAIKDGVLDWAEDEFSRLWGLMEEDAAATGPRMSLDTAFRKHLSQIQGRTWLLEFLAEIELGMPAAEELDKISAKGELLAGGAHCENRPWSDGEGDRIFPLGYVQILGSMREERRLENFEIKFDWRAQHIAHNLSGAYITSANGKQISANYTIITVSIGVLQSGGIIFSPPLSDAKTQAISRSAMGILDKVLLQFNSLPPQLDSHFGIADVSALLDGKMGEFHNLNAYSLSQPALVGLAHGDTARRLERIPDEEIVLEMMATLRTNFPDLDDPENYSITRWAADPNTKGSYSYWPVNLSLVDKYALQEPEGRLFFAGEGTSICDWGSVHGAMLTGKDAARKIMIGLNIVSTEIEASVAYPQFVFTWIYMIIATFLLCYRT